MYPLLLFTLGMAIPPWLPAPLPWPYWRCPVAGLAGAPACWSLCAPDWH